MCLGITALVMFFVGGASAPSRHLYSHADEKAIPKPMRLVESVAAKEWIGRCRFG
jgi:hypothetical protein